MEKKFIIGVDLGGTNLKASLLDLRYNIIKKEIIDTRRSFDKNKLVCVIIDTINKIISSNRLKKTQVLGVGLGVPGPADPQNGIVHFLPNIPGLREINLKKTLERELGVSVFLDNDAKLMGLAEYRLGQARRFRNVLCITLGTGVGGAVILNGSLYRGADNASGEVGHIPINEDGPSCGCGAKACLEAYIGNRRVEKEIQRIFRRRISLEELSVLANRGNRQALEVWFKFGERLGLALSGIVNLLNLDAIVIGGGVANAGNALLNKVRQTIKDRAMSIQARRVKVLRARLGNDAGLIGAAIMVREGQR